MKAFLPASILATALCLSLLTACQSPAPMHSQTPVALTVAQNSGWWFVKHDSDLSTAELQQQTWQAVTLPHTANIEPRVVNDQWQGFTWYKKTLNLPSNWQQRQISLRFEGAMNVADVWLNGVQVGHHAGGYLPFTLDISQALSASGNNELLMRLDNRDNPVTGPKPLKILDFNMYGGLYRGVSLISKPLVHITDEMLANQVAGGGVFVTYPAVSESQARVLVATHLENSSAASASVKLVQRLLWQGELAAEASSELSLLPGQAQETTQKLTLDAPQLWSPATPHLYQLETEVYQQDKLLERQQRDIGVREFRFNANHELLINGQPTFLRGVNRHQEYPYVGYALSPAADYRDAVKIKSAGFDYVRLSHYPHSPDFMRAADKLGLVLLDSILGWQYYSDDPAFIEHVAQTCRDLIRRDRNHPSVLAWECSLNESGMPESLIAQLRQIVGEESKGGYSAGWMHGYDIYLQARQHRLQHYQTPSQPYNVSEYGDWEYYAQNAGLNQDNWGELKEFERTSRQLLESGEARLLQQALNLQEAHNDNLTTPAFADGYWVMFDYNRGYADDLEASGIMSIERLPKYSYYFYQSQRDASQTSADFAAGPMVYIASDWQPGSANTVRVFSNTDEVALFLNNRLVARQTPSASPLSSHLAHPPFEFHLDAFLAGELKAVGYIDGKPVAEHKVHTPGPFSQLQLSADVCGARVSGSDTLFVYATLADASGQPLRRSGDAVQFSLEGDGRLLSPQQISSTRGRAAALVQTGDDISSIQIQATVDGVQARASLAQLAQNLRQCAGDLL